MKCLNASFPRAVFLQRVNNGNPSNNYIKPDMVKLTEALLLQSLGAGEPLFESHLARTRLPTKNAATSSVTRSTTSLGSGMWFLTGRGCPNPPDRPVLVPFTCILFCHPVGTEKMFI